MNDPLGLWMLPINGSDIFYVPLMLNYQIFTRSSGFT